MKRQKELQKSISDWNELGYPSFSEFIIDRSKDYPGAIEDFVAGGMKEVIKFIAESIVDLKKETSNEDYVTYKMMNEGYNIAIDDIVYLLTREEL